MPPPPTKETALHLYRSLLRTASYLPTLSTRKWVTNRITHRFRRKTEMSDKNYKDGKQIMGQLDRATHGDMDALHKVFSYTYGRSGPRRRALLSSTVDILHKSDLANPPPRPPMVVDRSVKPRVARLSRDHNRGGGLNQPTKEPSPFLTAYQHFLKDQEVHRPKDLLGRNHIKFIDPPIPQLSSWFRPLAIKRERGVVERWVEEGLDNVVPPLPAAEWEFLRSMAVGSKRQEKPPRRRIKVGEWEQENKSMLTLENIKFGIGHTQRERMKVKNDERQFHTITPQLLRRMHAKIWYASPKMEWNGERGKWVYTWGSRKETRVGGESLVPRDEQIWELDLDTQGVDNHKIKRGKKPENMKVLPEMPQEEAKEKEGLHSQNIEEVRIRSKYPRKSPEAEEAEPMWSYLLKERAREKAARWKKVPGYITPGLRMGGDGSPVRLLIRWGGRG